MLSIELGLDVNVNRHWLYASVFEGWWRYDNEHNNKLNRLYKDHCQRFGINYVDYKQLENKQVNDNINEDSEFVNFDNFSDEKENGVVDYMVRTSHDTFQVDFKNMKQINVYSPNKKREIVFIDVPNDIFGKRDETIEYLKKKNVKGVSGIKWS